MKAAEYFSVTVPPESVAQARRIDEDKGVRDGHAAFDYEQVVLRTLIRLLGEGAVLMDSLLGAGDPSIDAELVNAGIRVAVIIRNTSSARLSADSVIETVQDVQKAGFDRILIVGGRLMRCRRPVGNEQRGSG